MKPDRESPVHHSTTHTTPQGKSVASRAFQWRRGALRTPLIQRVPAGCSDFCFFCYDALLDCQQDVAICQQFLASLFPLCVLL